MTALEKGPSINYVSTFKGEGGMKMLMVAYARGRGVSGMLTSALSTFESKMN